MSGLEVDVLGDALDAEQVRRACVLAAASAGLEAGHVAVAFVDAEAIGRLNAEHRGKPGPTDVLSFPVDGDDAIAGPPALRELGDVVICPEHTHDLARGGRPWCAPPRGHGPRGGRRGDAGPPGGDRVVDPLSTRSGFVALAGRPNVGKSTLVNAMVGRKVAIVSDKPQTTRRAIRGVATRDDVQMVLIDLPGVQRPRDELTRRMQHRVEQEVGEADAALMVVNGDQGVGGGGDRWIAEALGRARVPVVVAVNKVDRIAHPRAVVALQAAADLVPGAEVFPVSARTGAGVEALMDHLAGLLPPGPFYFPPDEVSDQPEDVLLAELVREQVLARTRQELPHAVEVQVEEIEDRGNVVAVRALLWVETESQKGIVIGAGGRMIKSIGTAARRELERELGVRVHLDLSVRVRRSWRADDALLDRLGIT